MIGERYWLKLVRGKCFKYMSSGTLAYTLKNCRLISLDKNPRVCPIGAGEILRRNAAKVAIAATRNGVITSDKSLQVSARYDAGAEALVHVIPSLYNGWKTEAVILVDAENALNAVDRKAFLPDRHLRAQLLFQAIALVFIGGVEISSPEGTTHSDPIAMVVYVLAIILLIWWFSNNRLISHGTSKAAM